MWVQVPQMPQCVALDMTIYLSTAAHNDEDTCTHTMNLDKAKGHVTHEPRAVTMRL